MIGSRGRRCKRLEYYLPHRQLKMQTFVRNHANANAKVKSSTMTIAGDKGIPEGFMHTCSMHVSEGKGYLRRSQTATMLCQRRISGKRTVGLSFWGDIRASSRLLLLDSVAGTSGTLSFWLRASHTTSWLKSRQDYSVQNPLLGSRWIEDRAQGPWGCLGGCLPLRRSLVLWLSSSPQRKSKETANCSNKDSNGTSTIMVGNCTHLFGSIRTYYLMRANGFLWSSTAR